MLYHFHRTRVGSLEDLVQVVDQSAKANVAQLVGAQEGEVIVPMYNWSRMFKWRLRKIKKYQHFHFSATCRRCISYKVESDSEEEVVSLLLDPTWSPTQHDTPEHVLPTGLSPK